MNNIKNHLPKQLLEIIHCIYFWVHFMFDYLKQNFKKTEKRIDIIINTFPRSVNAVYEKILNKSKEGRKTWKILSIILAAIKLLTSKKLNIAVNVEFSLEFMSQKTLILRLKKTLNIMFETGMNYLFPFTIIKSIFGTKLHENFLFKNQLH